MVSTHQQYLCPDFLNPSPPATMDSSPLALLAQTCNSIGLPDHPPASSSSSTTPGSKSGKTDKASGTKEDGLSKGGSKKATSSAADSTCDSSAGARTSPATSSSAGKEINGGNRSTPESARKSENRSRTGRASADTKSTTDDTKSTTASSTTSGSGAIPISSSTPSTAAASVTSLLLNKCMTAANPLLASYPSGPYPSPANLFPAYFAAANSTPTFPYGHIPSLASAFGSSCYPSPFQSASNPWGLPPPSMPGFAPKCTDPFCKTCPATLSGIRGCSIGCPCGTSGVHHGHSGGGGADLPLWLSSYGSLFGQSAVGMHGSPLANPASLYAAAAAAAAAAQHHQAAAAAAVAVAASTANSMTLTSGTISSTNQSQQQQQHTCSWMTGSEFCGKRFSSSEELLQHLRSHTSHDSAAAAAAANGAVVSSGAQSAVITTSPSSIVVAPIPHLSAGPPAAASNGRLSPRSTYLSSLNSLRYHPYAKLTPPAMPSALASLPFPSSVPSFSPLSALCTTLSAQRLPASLPHP